MTVRLFGYRQSRGAEEITVWTAAFVSGRPRPGLRLLATAPAAMLLAAWLEAGLVVEFPHNRYALTAKGDRLALPEQEATRRFQEAGEGS